MEPNISSQHVVSLHCSITKTERNISVHSYLDDFQQTGSSLVVEAVALVTEGQTCIGALSENELI